MDLLVLLTLAATCLASLSGHAVESQSQAEAYWKAKLGNTPMPKAIIDSLEASKEDLSTIDAQGLEVANNIDKYDLERVPIIYGRRYASASKEDPNTSEELEATNIDKYDLERIPIIYGRRYALASEEDPGTSEGLEAANIDKYDLERFPLIYGRRYASASKEDPGTSEGLEAANINKYGLERVPIFYGRRDASASKEDPSTSEGLEAVANIDKYDLERVPIIYGPRDASASKEDPSTNGEDNKIDAKGLDIFFLNNRLTHPGGTLKLHFNRGCKSKFLPIQVAKLIPFSHDKVPEILNLFSVRPDSTQAKLIKETIIGCEESPVGGEDDKYCATSLEDLVDYVVSKIGSQFKVLSTTIDKDVTAEYTIEKAHKVSSDGNFVCHKARYPYAMFHCHRIRNTDAYVVSLIDANGQKSKVAAVCHRDTSSWNPEHLAFQLLKVEPGSVPVCHFVGAHDMIWTWNEMPLANDQAQSL